MRLLHRLWLKFQQRRTLAMLKDNRDDTEALMCERWRIEGDLASLTTERRDLQSQASELAALIGPPTLPTPIAPWPARHPLLDYSRKASR